MHVRQLTLDKTLETSEVFTAFYLNRNLSSEAILEPEKWHLETSEVLNAESCLGPGCN